MPKDLNKIAAIEKAMAKKFGPESIINPKSRWDDEKEKEYLIQLKEFYSKNKRLEEKTEKIENDGFLVSKNLITKKSKRKCPVCEIFSFSKKDDVYMNKFDCCYSCHNAWIEGREERWLKGWRPDDN